MIARHLSSEHLSSEQLSECILGQPRPMVARHVEDCPACRAELIQFREALGEFGAPSAHGARIKRTRY